MKLARHMMILGIALLILTPGGCEKPSDSIATSSRVVERDTSAQMQPAPSTGASALRCRFTVGHDETVRLRTSHLYRSWLEMPGKEPSQVSSSLTEQEFITRRQVESVAPDGSATIKVAIQSVKSVLSKDVSDKKTTHKYISTPDKTSSTGAAQPALSGATFKIIMAPDTTVTAIMGLDQLRENLEISADSGRIAGRFLDEQRIKDRHQRRFLQHSPSDVPAAGASTYSLPDTYGKLVEIPDPMIKALAVKNTYHVGPVTRQDGADVVSVTLTGQAKHSVPEDFPPAPKVTRFEAVLIQNNSDMQKLDITGNAVFDLTSGQVRSDTTSGDCLLVLLEENLFGGVPEARKRTTGGKMFTEIKLSQEFTVLP